LNGAENVSRGASQRVLARGLSTAGRRADGLGLFRPWSYTVLGLKRLPSLAFLCLDRTNVGGQKLPSRLPEGSEVRVTASLDREQQAFAQQSLRGRPPTHVVLAVVVERIKALANGDSASKNRRGRARRHAPIEYLGNGNEGGEDQLNASQAKVDAHGALRIRVIPPDRCVHVPEDRVLVV
jgi:hypothetical protein